MYRNTSDTNLEPLNSMHNKGVRRQDHGSIFVRNGAIYITKTDYLIENKLIISDSPLFVEMNKIDSINIDTVEDLELFRRIVCK